MTINTIKTRLGNWVESLNSQIGDTKQEIANRRAMNDKAVVVRSDLKSLIEYIETNDLPAPVCRALNYCLGWNPFANR